MKDPWRVGAGGWLTTGVGSTVYAGLGFHSLRRHSLDAGLSLWFGQSYFAAYLKGKVRLGGNVPSYLSIDGLVSRKKYYDSLPFFFSSGDVSSFISHDCFGRVSYQVGAGRSAYAAASLSAGKAYGVGKARLAFRYLYDTLDERTFPTEGRRIHAEVSGTRYDAPAARGAEVRGRLKFEGSWNNYYRIGNSFRIGALARAGLAVGSPFSDRDTESMLATSFEPIEILSNCYLPALRGDDYIALGAVPVWCPMSNLQVRGEAYAYTGLRDGGAWKAPFSTTEFIGRVSVVGTLPFATLSVSAAYCTPLSGWNFSLALGWYVPAPHD